MMGYRISINGFITKSRSCISGCGMTRSGSLTLMSSYSSMSMSMSRSWYSPFTDFCVRPILRSICCVTSNSPCGDNVVSTHATLFTNALSDLNPQGSECSSFERRTIQPMLFSINRYARRMLHSFCPRFEPKPRYALCVVVWLMTGNVCTLPV